MAVVLFVCIRIFIFGSYGCGTL